MGGKLKNICLLSPDSGSPRTAVALGLALKLEDAGLKVGFFQPVGTGAGDEEASLFKAVFKLGHPLETICPFRAGPSYLSASASAGGARRHVLEAYAAVKQDADVVIINSPPLPYVAASVGLETESLVSSLEALSVLVTRVTDDYKIDLVIYYDYHLRMRNIPVLGHIFNDVSHPLLVKTEEVYRPVLAKAGCNLLGVIPARTGITAPTAAEYYEALGGELLAGQDNLGLAVEEVIVGAMTVESALRYLRRSTHKAVITGGDRADLALAALATGASVLVLTGGLYPDPQVIARAEERNIPVILVGYDTYSTLEKMNQVVHHMRPVDEQSLAGVRSDIENHCRWDDILSALRS